MEPDDNCFCGKPLHYTDSEIEASVRKLVDTLGRFIPVTVGARTWLVDRHYIALHGIKGAELPFLGFKEVI